MITGIEIIPKMIFIKPILPNLTENSREKSKKLCT